MTTPASQFLLLLRQPAEGPGPTPEEQRHIMARFGGWMAALSAQGQVAGTHGLAPVGKVLRGSRGASTTDGPFAETKEIIGGYLLINAESLDHAVEIARDCPGLDYRLSVEIRPIQDRNQSS